VLAALLGTLAFAASAVAASAADGALTSVSALATHTLDTAPQPHTAVALPSVAQAAAPAAGAVQQVSTATTGTLAKVSTAAPVTRIAAPVTGIAAPVTRIAAPASGVLARVLATASSGGADRGEPPAHSSTAAGSGPVHVGSAAGRLLRHALADSAATLTRSGSKAGKTARSQVAADSAPLTGGGAGLQPPGRRATTPASALAPAAGSPSPATEVSAVGGDQAPAGWTFALLCTRSALAGCAVQLTEAQGALTPLAPLTGGLSSIVGTLGQGPLTAALRSSDRPPPAPAQSAPGPMATPGGISPTAGAGSGIALSLSLALAALLALAAAPIMRRLRPALERYGEAPFALISARPG
jgi:hypothetical protein